MAASKGLRVLRGPNWQNGDADGGEGHPGTVVELLSNGTVRVVWDCGQECTCKTGADGKFELRAFDTAPIGVRHKGSVCAACGEKDIYGMLWQCTQCKSCSLCSLCYFLDKHDISHVFERNDSENKREMVKKRSASLKIRSVGMYPGAKAVRGRDWNWGDQDGGEGSVGQILGFENVSPSSSRDLVRIKWPSGQENSYRLGFGGCVDLKCVEEVPGIYYYRDHLPVVDTIGKKDLSSSTSLKTSSSLPQGKSSEPAVPGNRLQSFGACARPGVEVQLKDKVAIKVGEDKLRQMQASYGGTTAAMIQCIGQTGEVTSFVANGAVTVKFKRLSYRLNPQVLCRVSNIHSGDMVQIRPDLEEVKVLNKRLGWKSEMAATCGHVGEVVKIDEEGDLVVTFGKVMYMYAPACCIPSPGSKMDVLAEDNANPSNSSQSSGSGGGEENELHQKLMKMLAQLMVSGERHLSTGAEDDIEMAQLCHAINKGDVDAVKAVCEADRSVLSRVYLGMTLLMVASHEGHHSIVNALLNQGADVNATGDKDNTALGAALEGKKESTALLLLKWGANPRMLNNKKRSPAHVAAYNNMAEVLRELIRLGADINVKDEFQDAPLHDAIEKDNKEAIDVLVDSPSQKLGLQNRKGFNMLQLACLRGCVYAVEKILKRDITSVNELMKGEFNALHIAVTNDHVECARLLLAEGKASVNMKGSQGLTALHLSCNEAFPRCVELLLTYGAEVNITADDGNTPLHLALGTRSTHLKKNQTEDAEKQEHRKRVTVACMLLEKGAFIDFKNKKGAEPLQCCRPETIRKGFKQFVEQNPGCIRRQGQDGTGRRSTSGDTNGTMGNLLQLINLPCGNCFERSNITLKPCGHRALCSDCCLKVTECPFCHQYIEERLVSGSSDGRDLSEEKLRELCKPM